MSKRRRRFKQSVAFKDRLMSFANELRREATNLPAGHDRDELFKRAQRADTAAQFDDWAARSPQLPW